MSTINKHIGELANNNKNLPPVEATALIFSATLKLSIPQLATRAGVSSQAAYVDIRGGKPCPRFRNKIQEVLGFVPWAN